MAGYKTPLNPVGGAGKGAANLPSMAHFNDVTVNGNLSLSATSKVEGNLIPDTDDNRTLGDATHRWRQAFFVNQPNITDLDVDTIDFDNVNQDVRLSRSAPNTLRLGAGDAFVADTVTADTVTVNTALNLPNQAANTVLAGPASGASAAPAFRSLVESDIPFSPFPSGGIIMILSGTCPAGFVEETALNGKFVLGTLNASGDIGTTGGSDNITPTGTVSQPTFTGNAVTPTGTVSQPTFTGNALAGHAHELPFHDGAGTTGMFVLDASVFGEGTSRQARDTWSTTDSTSNSAVLLSQSVSAGTPSGTVSQPTFTGNQFTPAGTVSQPTFTGNQFDNRPAFVKVIFCRKT